MILLAVILLFHFVFGFLIENLKNRIVSIPMNLLLLGCAFLFTLGITYTADWFLYYWYYRYEVETTDFVYLQLSKIFLSYHLDYEYLFMFHISCSLLLYWLLINKFTRNYFYVFLIYLLLDYVHFTNQIRYYMGFPIMMIGYYYLLNKKSFIISIPLIILAILCHSGLAALLIFIPIFYLIPTKNFTKYILIGSLIMAIFIYLVTSGGMILTLEHYDAYFGKEYDSSIVGGLFNALPYIVYYVFFAIEFPRLLQRKTVADVKNHNFLLKITIFPIIFLPASLMLQILGHRYIMPFAIFWIISYLYLINDLPQKKRFFRMVIFSCVHFIALFSIYILPDFLLPQNTFGREMELTIKSIPYLKDLFF